MSLIIRREEISPLRDKKFYSWKQTFISLYLKTDGGDFGFDGRNLYLLIAIAQWLTEPKTNQTKNANAWKSLLKRAELVKAYA